jgi:hypothetical protein
MKSTFKPVGLVLALVLFCAFNAKAVTSSVPLSDVSLLTPYAEFGNDLFESLVTINGRVGVSNGGTLTVMGPSVINGNVDVGIGATLTGPGRINGTITQGLDLSAPQSQVFSASTFFSGLPADQTFSTLNSAQSFTAAPGTTRVVNVTNGLNLNNENISFSGGGDLVLNVGGPFNLVGSASILTSDPSHVFINYTGTSGVQTHVGDIIDGFLFIPNATGTSNLDGTFLGGLYAGNGRVSLMSNATLTGVTPVIPEGSTALLLAVVGLFAGIAALVRRTRSGVKQPLGCPRPA